MAFSGTYAYAPGAGDLVLAAFARIGKRRTEIVSEHMADAYSEANLMLSDWSTKPGPNWWATDTVTQVLTASDGTYELSATTIQIVAAYISTGSGADTVDRIIAPLSTYEYEALPNKVQEGFPTSYWFDRQTTPTITLYPVPDDTQTYTLKIRRWRQIQDTSLQSGTQPEIPWRFLDVFVWGLAARLAWIYAPDRAEKIEMRAKMAWDQASTNDAEQVPIVIFPGLGSYYS